ncbi:MAG: hypothetical protein ACO20Y_04320 [Poseidonia sp.]
MNKANRAHGRSQKRRKAVSMVALMLLMSMSPLLTLSTVSAHAEPSGVSWPLEGSNDTGWVRLDASGANPLTGQQATADWNLSFAPGAVLSNVTLEIRASGEDGLTINEPHLTVNGMGTSLFDWRGLGTLGQADNFASGSIYTGRLNPNSNSGAGWDLPSDAEITEMIIEVLSPSDPLVSLRPVTFEINDAEVDDASGLLYLATTTKLLLLNANNDPVIVDAYDFESEGGVLDIVVDDTNAVLHLLLGDGSFRAMSLIDSSTLAALGDGEVDRFLMTGAGDVFAAGGTGLYEWDGGAWKQRVVSTSSDAPSQALAMAEVNGIVYASIEGAGVLRYNTANAQALSTWSTANSLHSDNVVHILPSGNQLLLGSTDAGVGRFDYAAGFWLSTWTSANWLDSDDIAGIQRVGSVLYILNGDSVHTYNVSNGVFSTNYDLSNLNLAGNGASLLLWDGAGVGSPSTPALLVDDASGTLAHLSPGQAPFFEGNIVLASGPATTEMIDIVELDNILYISTGDASGILRYDIGNAVWMTPWTGLNDDAVALVTAPSSTGATSLFAATWAQPTVKELSQAGQVLTTYDGTSGCYPSTSEIVGLAVDANNVVMSLDSGVFVHFQRTGQQAGACTAYDTANGLPSSFLGDVALFGGNAYVATEDKGVLRYNIANDTWLEPWGSTGINGVNNAPVAMVGDVLYLGLQGYGVVRKDMSTGEILSPLLASNQGGVLPSNQIYALESDGSNLYIGTQQGARKWDGNQATNFGQGSTWQTRPFQFFDFVIDGGDLYAGTNIGVCKYTLSTMAVNDCQNVYDGMPNWATYSVGVDASYVYGGTNDGVGLITKSNFQHDTNWGEGTQTGNAVVEIMGDIAYIGTEGLGVLRYNITSNQWLTPFNEDNGVLDGGNDDVTGLVADIRPNLLWVGGDDGFQLINVTNGFEAFDIERNSNLYTASGPPHEMVIHNNILYYHASTASDEVSRLDVANVTALSNLDIGAQVGENGGDITSMEIVGDELLVSVVSGQWWNADGSGGIARWDTVNASFAPNVLPTGSIDRVTAYESSAGNTWVAWGELKLDLYDANRSLVNSWTSFDLPIRGIVEYDGETLFATEDGVLRYNETTNQWNSKWEAGNGLPSNAGSRFFELWTDGNDLVIGGARFSNFGGFQEGIISHLSASGAWTTYPADSLANVPDGYPISMEMCGGVLNVAMYNGNGGIARIDLQNGTLSPLARTQLDGIGPASVTCDAQDTLYIGYYNDNQPVSRYSYVSGAFLSSLTTSSHNLPSDRVWYDGLAHSGTQLLVGHGIGLSGTNVIGGGYSTLVANGATALQAQVYSGGSSVTSFQWQSGSSQWLIGQAGGASGYSHVSSLSSNGMQKIVDLPGLVSGQVSAMTANSTHIWAATGGGQTGGAGNFGGSGTGLLQGIFLPNGSVEWTYGWTLPGNTVANDLMLNGGDLYIASNPDGLYKLNLRTQSITAISGSLHGKFDTMHLYNGEYVIGLAGDGGSPPGVQMFDPSTGQFGNGRLIAGLPSNIINGFTSTTDVLYIATNGGIGRWNYSTNDWMDSITAGNGLPNDIVEDVVSVGDDIYMATPSGVFVWDASTGNGTTMTTANGLMGQSAWGLVKHTSSSGSVSVLVSHDGRGAERPGVSIVDATTQQVTSTHRFDQLPSNTVTALTSDWWGLHIATDGWPLTHWNASSGDFEDGVRFTQVQYPVHSMFSNGDQLLALGGENDGMLVEARTLAHASLQTFRPGSVTGGTLGANTIWIITEDGLQGWANNRQYTPVQEISMRRALPLTLRAMNNGGGVDVSNMTHPGMPVQLVDAAAPFQLDSAQGTPGVHNLLFQNVPVVMTSPVEGAAVWAKAVSLEYDVTLNISGDPALGLNLQDAVDNGQLFNNTRHVSLRLYSPANGSLEARITYDYVRSDTPVAMEGLVDRPDDGGSTLTASWSLVHDEDFARYLIFVNEGPWSTSPTELMLQGQSPDKAISLHSRLSADVETANGQPLQDGVDYYATVVVEYSDGRWGEVADALGPASPSDEIPGAPLWASAQALGSSGDDGDVELEWARCTALDLARTNIYVATTPMTDAYGRTPYTSIAPNEGNLSVLSLTPAVPVWIGLTCVDEAGQENLANVTVVGPIVPTGELNDNEAPEPVEGTTASDIPDDEGGRLLVTWNQSDAEDCAFYTVLIKQGDHVPENGERAGVDGFSQAAVVNPCDETEAVISSMDGVPLIDGQVYTFGVVAYDVWLNGNTDEVTLVRATPFQNIVGQGSTPPRITSLMAFDHPDDDGTAIDVVWEPSTVDDFASYTVWVSNRPVSNLASAYAAFGTDPDACGCFSFNKQWIDERTNPIELTLSTALYVPDGGELTDGNLGLIQPDVNLYVAVTVHDLKGNVHLTNLTQATVTPIDNQNDITAPDRVTDLDLRDRPNDDGTALLLDFEPSTSGDVAFYEVHAATYDFAGAVNAQLPSVATLGRNPTFPVVIDIVAGDAPVVPGQEIWVAVVAVDTSGNAHTTQLTMVSAASTDEGVTDAGIYLPDIENVEAAWFEDTNILVEWQHSIDANVRGYHVYISDEMFVSTEDATMVGQTVSDNTFLITAEIFDELDTASTWFVGVVPYDDTVAKSTVESVKVDPLQTDEQVGETSDETGQLSLDSLLTGPNIIAAGMVIIILLLLVLVVRSRGASSRKAKGWELQEATWGIQDKDWSDVPPAPPSMAAPAPPQGVSTQQANDIYAAADQIRATSTGREVYQQQQPVLRPQVDPSLLDGLLDEAPATPKMPQIDTSFLDDLL